MWILMNIDYFNTKWSYKEIFVLWPPNPNPEERGMGLDTTCPDLGEVEISGAFSPLSKTSVLS
jgi:hypothetical protein